jgi:2-amino-4-hydroxy-6-hydroxymethyldihydropteridine diphosphokinase
MKNLAYFSLGSNIHPEENLPAAVRLLEGYGKVVAVSSVWESPPLGPRDQPNYLNAAVCLRTALSLRQCQEKLVPEIERALGRVRTTDKHAPRTIDIDLMLFNREVTTIGHRSIPNEEILERPFVAIPLAEIAPHYVHPLTGQTLAEIAAKFKLSEGALQKRTDVVLGETLKNG